MSVPRKESPTERQCQFLGAGLAEGLPSVDFTPIFCPNPNNDAGLMFIPLKVGRFKRSPYF